MKTLSCREAGCECDYIAKGETEEEVIRDAAGHGIKEHGKKQEDMTQMKEMLRALIHDSSSTSTGTATSLRQPTEPG
jgi:predicted small metal-binding protein